MDCTHEVQFNGLCALCGAVLETNDNTKTHINMSHDNMGLTVSRQEAERLEHENAERLLEDRKLSLILDLDQTVVHATWDPTVGDWMRDENNTNHPATKDIRKFTLPGSSLMYYIKLRPGLSEFLRKVSEKYELHIYTMGTRHYAEAVAREIDPEDKLFRGRILSRDESGSVTQKKIQRLFPCDTSMVVVLDDRSDVWSFSPNLIKIKPYEFFVGIGDINSPFAPKQIPDVPAQPPKPRNEIGKHTDKGEKITDSKKEGEVKEIREDNKKEENDNEDGDDKEEEGEEGDEENGDESKILEEQEKIQEAMAKEQQQQRPLAQKQNELAPGQDRPLLVDNDKELYTMTEILTEVHDRFYKGLEIYNKQQTENGTGTPVEKPDVKDLIPQMKKKVLNDIHIVFSGLIPQQQTLSDSMYWRLAESFGAVCLPDLTGNVTHVIAAKAGTDKVNRARRTNKIFIVTIDWLLDSAARWEKQDEKRYILPSLNPSGDSGEVEVENPESTPFDDGAFDPDEHSLGEDVDWDEMDREVDDALNESGTDIGDTDSEAIDSPTSSQNSYIKKARRKRDGYNNRSESESEEEAKSPLAKRRMTTAMRGRSQLSQVSTLDDNEMESDNNSIPDSDMGVPDLGDVDDEENKQSDYYGDEDHIGYDEEEEEDDDSSSLDDFAGALDDEIE
ncbi:hypothetical protein INT45_010212 [Circinella minor]|uniref:RNA polymerase II subunit A C-terminal domain phosphatase n=1 Tax=Circinella minor TaxID=1195481 RepID=A0A8H7SF44_9FUNG|nr:hypothetical protein INT45_010212 [Circinella minor]